MAPTYFDGVIIYKFRNLNTGQAMPIPPGEYTVGREDDTHVHVEDGSVSRYHAKVFNLNDEFFIEDSGSVNGTASEGSFLKGRVKLNFGDVVYIGSVPFRVDPEVNGGADPEPTPQAGMRPTRAYMKRNTERLPIAGEGTRFVESFSAEKLTTPDLSAANDIDAEELNAITMNEPVPPAPKLPTFTLTKSSATTLAPAGGSVGATISPSVGLHSTAPAKRQGDVAPSKPTSVVSQSPMVPSITTPLKGYSPATLSAAAKVETSPSSSKWGWYLVMFLAGLGAGLFIGLYFAKVFIEMGGKVGALP